MRVVTPIDRPAHVWVRWHVAGGRSNWHQVREDAVRPARADTVVRLQRIRTRCGLDVFDVRELETWPADAKPVGQTCMYCVQWFLLDTLPPLGTPPAPGRSRELRFTVTPGRNGSVQAPAATPR